MFVSQSMTKELITIGKETGILEIRKTMDENKVRHLPVVDDAGLLLGMVTDRDVRSAMPKIVLDDSDSGEARERLSSLKARDIMTSDLITVPPTYTLQDVLILFQQYHFGALPVVDEQGHLEGIISTRDLLRAFVNVMGIGEPGALVGILAKNEVGQMKKIVDIITSENISMGSILVARHWEDGKRAVFPYLLTNKLARIKERLKEAGYELLDPMQWHLDQLPKNE